MPGDLPLQLAPLTASCTDTLTCWGSGNFFEAMNSRIAAVMGMAAFMMIVGTVTFLALQNWSKNYTVPAVVLVLSGGIVFGMLPAPVAQVGYVIVLMAGSLGLFGLLWAVIR